MPQHSMFPTDPRIDGCRIELVDRTMDLVDGFDLSVVLRHDQGEWRTFHSARYSGVMSDLLPGAAGDLVGAFLFGEGRRDVLLAAQSNHRVAKAHERRHALR